VPELRSRITTHGRNAAGARALWRATGMTDGDFGKPIVAIANSYTQFVPGHVHLRDLGDIVAEAIKEAGGTAREFHTIAVDDGIAMGHGGMLYSLPSREVIADAVEYMVNGHAADALVCISNCDKITPGMLNAAMRLNIPTVFVSGGPMEAGKAVVVNGVTHPSSDLITAISASANDQVDELALTAVEQSACPTCGSCSGMFTANSMNCLTEALGLALPGNGSTLATHAARRDLFTRAGTTVMELARRWYAEDDASVLPRSIATRDAFVNAMALDMAMGGSTNTVLHLLAMAQEAGVDFTMSDIDRLSRKVPNICKVAPSSHYHVEDVHRAGGVFSILGELDKAGHAQEARDQACEHAHRQNEDQCGDRVVDPILRQNFADDMIWHEAVTPLRVGFGIGQFSLHCATVLKHEDCRDRRPRLPSDQALQAEGVAQRHQLDAALLDIELDGMCTFCSIGCPSRWQHTFARIPRASSARPRQSSAPVTRNQRMKFSLPSGHRKPAPSMVSTAVASSVSPKAGWYLCERISHRYSSPATLDMNWTNPPPSAMKMT